MPGVSRTSGKDAVQSRTPDIDDEEDLERSRELLRMMTNLRMGFLEYKTHIKEYLKIRKLHSEVIQSMQKFYDSGSFKAKVDSNYVPDDEVVSTGEPRQVILLSADYDFDSDVGVHAFYDTQIYKHAPNINCITEEYLIRGRFKKPDKVEFLRSMLNSVAGLFEVTKVEMYEGYVCLKEVFTGIEYRIIDIAMSGLQNSDDYYIYMRIITHNGISFGTGLNFSFRKNDPFIRRYIKRTVGKPPSIRGFSMFVELYNQFSKDSKRIEVVTNALR